MTNSTDFKKSAFEGCDMYLEKLDQLTATDTDFTFWVTSAALHMCVYAQGVELNGWAKYPELIEKVTHGLDVIRNQALFTDLALDAMEDFEYCKALFTDTFIRKSCESKVMEVTRSIPTTLSTVDCTTIKLLEDPHICVHVSAFDSCKISTSLSYLMLP